VSAPAAVRRAPGASPAAPRPVRRAGARRARAAVAALAVAAALLAAAGAARAVTWEPADGLALRTVAEGFERPVHVASPPGDRRLFVVEQGGRILLVERGRPRARPFLDLTARVRAGGERGLLSLAFHPRYARNGLFFVNYTDRDGHTRIERYRVSSDPTVADPASGRTILRIEQPFANHNGGHILFGPDGMLWIGMGDGGGGGDPLGHGQNRATLLGAILRIDVDRGDPYAIPPDNPWPRTAGTRPELWAIGARNPWRLAMDPVERLVYVADVGQNRFEEVHVVPLAGGVNLGWNIMEGRACHRAQRCDTAGLDLPPVVYPHGEGCSITGGVVYRGRALPALAGHYLFADYCAGWIRSFRWAGGRVEAARAWRLPRVEAPVSFAVDGDGEVLVVSHAGRILRLEPARR